jgi:hypothetical protein
VTDREKEAVRRLGEAIGFGNMMTLASQCWREMLIERQGSDSGAFTVGPCVGTVRAWESEGRVIVNSMGEVIGFHGENP